MTNEKKKKKKTSPRDSFSEVAKWNTQRWPNQLHTTCDTHTMMPNESCNKHVVHFASHGFLHITQSTVSRGVAIRVFLLFLFFWKLLIVDLDTLSLSQCFPLTPDLLGLNTVYLRLWHGSKLYANCETESYCGGDVSCDTAIDAVVVKMPFCDRDT